MPPVDKQASSRTADSARSLPAANTLTDAVEFFKAFLGHPRRTAAIVPSSNRLIERVARQAKVGEAACVVELGPGTGGSTRTLLGRMAPHSRLLAIEMNPGFHAHLCRHIPDARLRAECGSAEDLAEHLVAHRLPAPDAIVSGIPFSTMPVATGERIAAAIARSLAPGGRFVAYQWTPSVAERTTPHLGEPRQEWELWNLPPMRVYTWVKPR